MRLFLGVDGGKSGTTALIGDETGRVLGTGRAGPCNHAAESEGRAKLERAVRDSMAAACAEAGLVPSAIRFEAACLGMSGGPDDKRAILSELLVTGQLIVTTDAEIALSAAVEAGQGIIVIAGTGSIALGRRHAGQLVRAGGWGYVFGDEGSAFDIVRQALRAALRMEEGWGPPTALRQALLEATGSVDSNETLHRFYTPDWPRDRVASLAPLVDTAAGAGDGVALEILNAAAQQLAMSAASVRAQLWNPGEPVEVAYLGGVFQSTRVRERFRLLVELESASRCGPPKRSAAEGALLEAYRAAGLNVTPG
ncbi:MAG TPA: BadF/BadG/BcrA/BcrD ATPase family protein [Bryobacteraceae bacterium]